MNPKVYFCAHACILFFYVYLLQVHLIAPCHHLNIYSTVDLRRRSSPEDNPISFNTQGKKGLKTNIITSHLPFSMIYNKLFFHGMSSSAFLILPQKTSCSDDCNLKKFAIYLERFHKGPIYKF